MNRPIWHGLIAAAICGLATTLAIIAWLEARPGDPNAAARRARMQRPDSPRDAGSPGGNVGDLLDGAESLADDFGAPLASAETVKLTETPPQLLFFIPEERHEPLVLPVSVLASDSTARATLPAPSPEEPRIYVRSSNTRAEEAIRRAHEWTARRQHPDGHWTFQIGEGDLRSDTAATALAVLEFLGTGNTHRRGRYKKNVDAGLQWLLKHMDSNTGQMMGPAENMLAHGLATIAVTEALAMTEDPSLKPPCAKAAAFIVGARDPVGGGWGWQPRESGGMTATAWQVMALQSARLAGIKVPREVGTASRGFINRCETAYGIFALQADGPPSADATAMALLCRSYLDGLSARGLQAGMAWLWDDANQSHLSLDGLFCEQLLLGLVDRTVSRRRDFSRPLEPLLLRQEHGGPEEGSWAPGTREERVGGRLYTTAMAALVLSAYFRHLPIAEREMTTFSPSNPWFPTIRRPKETGWDQ